jgi:uncharacterized damage-inducible protein DinB
MGNLDQFIRELTDYYDGDPWYGSSFRAIVDDVSDTEALALPGNGQSIARLLWHMIKWRRALTERLIGTAGYTASADDADNWVALASLNSEAWRQGKVEYARLQRLLLSELSHRSEDFLDDEWQPGRNYRTLIAGVIQHDIYHLGQIAMLRALWRSGRGAPAV